MKALTFTILALFVLSSGNELFTQNVNACLSGEYLGREKPNNTPIIFAPGVVSKIDEHEFGSVFSSDGREFYYGVDVNGISEIRFMICKDNKWSLPQKVSFGKGYSCNDPFLSPNDSMLFFISDMPKDSMSNKEDIDIWYVIRDEGGWSNPVNAGKMINSDKNEYYISFSSDGTLYFSSNSASTDTTIGDYDIYYSEFKDEMFQKPVRLSDNINTSGYEADVFVSPDESFMIFCSFRSSGYGQGDLYISFNENNFWTKAINMGTEINTSGHELCPFVTYDGKYLFYTSNKNIYWVDAVVIETLRKTKNAD